MNNLKKTFILDKPDISRKAIYRLSLYNRCLRRLIERGVETVSSELIASGVGVKSAQVRKDLGYFGQFGTRGRGYSVSTLQENIESVLGRAKLQPVILIGVGNLGKALLRYEGFLKEGFEVIAAFDSDPKKIGRRDDLSMPVYSNEGLKDFVKKNHVQMAILCVPAEHGQEIANDLVTCGIKGFLNLSPAMLQVPEGIAVTRVDLAMELENLSFFIEDPN